MSLRQYYDNHIKNKTRLDFIYHKIKNKMKNGEKEWKIELSDDDVCFCMAYEYPRIANNIFLINKELINLADFASTQGLDVCYESNKNKIYIIISW